MTTDDRDKYTTIGGEPIVFAGYQDGWLTVQAVETTSENSPCYPRRALLFAGLGEYPKHDRIAATLPPDVAADLAHRLAVAAGPDATRGLVAKLTAWLDAPRLAARATAEVVETRPARDGNGLVHLVRTSFGEWSVRNDSGGWFTGWERGRDSLGGREASERARGVFDIVSAKEIRQ